MSPKAFVRASFALLALTAAACSETLAPKLERIQSQIAIAFGCDVKWTGLGGDGQWQNPNNWTTLTVPTGTQDVCITDDVATTVVVRLDAFARNITIGAPGNATKQVLALEGFFAFQARANLTVGETIDNYGDFVLRGTGHFPAAPNLVAATIQNRSGARMIASDVGFSGGITYWVNATVVNDGLLELRYHTELRGHWTNRGTTQMVAGSGYNLPNGTWVQAGGSLAADGTFIITDGLFRLESGLVTGIDGPILERGSFTIADGAAATGNVTLRNTVAMSGDVPAGLTVMIAGHSYSTTGINFATVVTTPAGFRNDGTLRLIGTGHGFGQPSSLIVPGLIDNYGRIEVRPGPNNGMGRQLRASVHNRAGATIDITTPLEMNRIGAAYTNEGTIAVTPSTFVTLSGAPSFVQNGALSLGTNAQWKQEGGSFRLAGGAITGRAWLAGIALDIPAGSPGTGTLRLTLTNTITGDVPAGVTLHVEAWSTGSTGSSFDGILNAAASFTSFGTIVVGAPGFNPNQAKLAILNGATLTNRGRVETVFDQSGAHRYISGNFMNEGTLQLDNWTQFNGTVRSLAPAVVSMGSVGQGLFDLQPGATLIASGTWPLQLVNRGNLHIGAPGTAAALHLREYSGASSSSVTMDIGGSPTAPGVDFDKLSMTGPMTIGNGTLHVRALSACVDGGNSYDVIAYSHPSGNFAGFTGLDLGNGRTVQPVQLANGYRLNIIGLVCPPPDGTPPVIAPTVTGTLGNNGWYRSDVTVTWSVTDAESPVTSTTGCDATTLTTDNAGVTYRCSATSAGGTAERSVTIRRDATAPVVTTLRTPEANANGWNNTVVRAFFTATDAMSGIAGPASAEAIFNAEGSNMSHSESFTDNAGNTATGTIANVSIDWTAPHVVQASRTPAANAHGWNNTNVTAMYGARDNMGIDGPADVQQLFTMEGAGQSGSHTFADLAGNTVTATVSDINIDKTAPVVTVTRSPAPDATGWNNTDVTATWTATDALSGIDGSATATHVFNTDGASQSATRSFSDKAGNSGSATIGNINIDKTPTPPPVLTPSCSVTPNEIWPANNKMVPVRVTIGGLQVTGYRLRSVTNNESGPADVAGWAIGTADLDGSVLAKRNGSGSGRTYTLTYDVFGANGATGSCVVMVRVPHDQRR